jgi:SAM-dependent methyltransferase
MDLPFPNGFFSHICCFDTLHHMNDYPKTFQEMGRVLEPGGRAVFIEPGARHSRSAETIAFIETYKKDDPTWIERDVVLDEIEKISKESGFSSMLILPMLLPGLKSYTASQWTKFRRGDRSLEADYINFLKDFNYDAHLSFYCEGSCSHENHSLSILKDVTQYFPGKGSRQSYPLPGGKTVPKQ